MITLELELIGHAARQYLQLARAVCHEAGVMDFVGRVPSCGWVARITGVGGRYRFDRSFLRPLVDYTEAVGVGNRGIVARYFLSPGIYEVYSRMSWRRSERYFCRVSVASMVRLTECEVSEWFAKRD